MARHIEVHHFHIIWRNYEHTSIAMDGTQDQKSEEAEHLWLVAHQSNAKLQMLGSEELTIHHFLARGRSSP